MAQNPLYFPWSIRLVLKICKYINTHIFRKLKKIPQKSFSSVPFLSPFVWKGDLQEFHLVTFWHSVLGKAASESHFVPLKPRDTFHKVFSLILLCCCGQAPKSLFKNRTLETI